MKIVTTHKGTDFDGLASVIAGTLLYPGALPVIPKNLKPNVKMFLSAHKHLLKNVQPGDINIDEVETLIVVDTNNWGRLEGMSKLKNKDGLKIFLWDHHTNPSDIEADWECQRVIGANITNMIRHLRVERIHINPVHATLFLAGLYEDTGGLSFPSTTPDDVSAAEFLLRRRADLNILASFLRPGYEEKQKGVLIEMLKDQNKQNVNGYAISIRQIEVNTHVDNLAMVMHMYREIINVDAAFGIFVDTRRNSSMIIGRTNIDGLDIGTILRAMGGGGHPRAGSAVLKNVNPDAIAEWITELIKGSQQSSVKVSDLMSYPVIMASPTDSMEHVAALLREKGCTGVPIVDDGKLVGVLSRNDFKKIKREKHLKSPAKAFMSREIVTISPDKSPMLAAKLMVRHDVGRLPVIEDGNIIGIITRSDGMSYFYDTLPD